MAGKKILVADDSLTIQKVIRLALSGDGYEIQTVSDGKECLEQVSLFRPEICIIDVSLPGLDAYQLRERFLEKPDLKHIPIVLMSSTFEKVDEERMHRLGFSGHLVKPFDPSHLRSTLIAVSTEAPKADPITAAVIEPLIESTPEPENPFRFAPPKATTSFDEFPPLSNDFQGGLDDIQTLARNTFEMSGLDQHEWGMMEPGKVEGIDLNPEPSRSPPPPGQREITSMDFIDLPPAPELSAPVSSAPLYSAEEVEAMVKAEVARVLEEMHFQVQDRINHEMKLFTEEFMPNLAEKIIKEEIHKLLSNPPL
jgi:CheY-like chemotaxis protein